MALLVGVRRLEPLVDFKMHESPINFTDNQQEMKNITNSTFKDDCSPEDKGSTSFSVTLPGDSPPPLPTNSTISEAVMTNEISEILISAKKLTPSENSIHGVKSAGSDFGESPADGDKQHRANGGGSETGGNTALSKIPSKRSSVAQVKFEQETLLAICVQVFIPFLIAGTGTCGAGIILDYVEDWTVFQNVTEIFILVPTLLGLKGNLEMTLASRVSTQANLGKLDSFRQRWHMSWGNMALILVIMINFILTNNSRICQATVMGFLAAAFATVISIAKSDFYLPHALVLCASSLFTAVIASLILGSITVTVVIVAHRCNINPDNVATPIAASLGDITTLVILAAISSYLYKVKDNYVPAAIIIGIFILLTPVWVYLSYKNLSVRQVLYYGWAPVIIALIITSAGGSILEFSVSQFKGIAIFQPVVNGVAGDLVAVQSSRISTYFHQNCEKPGTRPPDGSSLCVSPFTAFFGRRCAHARTARILMAMVIPGHILFGYGITLIKGGDTALTPSFLPIYLISAFIQVASLLYIAQCLIQILWRMRVDPDNSAIPLLTALGDLSGIACLAMAFYIYRSI